VSRAKPSAPERPQSFRSKAARWALEIGLVLAVYFGVTWWREQSLLHTRTPAPAFSLKSLDGRTVSLADFKGKRVLLHFWATWCGVCRQEHGALNAVEHGLSKDEVLLSIVADSDDPEAVRRYVASEHIGYPVLLADERVVQAYKVSAFPTNYFVNADGAISGTTVGMTTRFGFDWRLGCAR
jgi:peroxiredoxin